MTEQKANEPSQPIYNSEDAITGKRVREEYKRSYLQIWEAIRTGKLHPKKGGQRIFDKIQDYYDKFDEGSARAGSKLGHGGFSEERLNAQWLHGIAWIAYKRHQKKKKDLPSEYPPQVGMV